MDCTEKAVPKKDYFLENEYYFDRDTERIMIFMFYVLFVRQNLK